MTISLYTYGWDEQMNKHLRNYPQEMVAGRVLTVHKTNYNVITSNGEYSCELSGQMQFNKTQNEWPHTGDWVMLLPFDNKGIITEVLPRKTVLARKYPGKTTDKQILTVNIDTAILVQGMDRDYNPARLERMLVGLNDAGINAIIVLNKIDIAPDAQQQIDHIRHLIPDTPVIGLSAMYGDQMEQLNALMQSKLTYVLLGTSGAGKSTLLNYLANQDLQKTNALSDAVGKGQHTTTGRELFLLPNGSLMIDTPGVREFALALDQPEMVASAFNEIDRLSRLCKYKDCTHTNEAGCAVIEAVHQHNLDEAVYNSYLKLKREADHYAASSMDKKRKSKDISKLVKKMKKDKIHRKYQ